MTSNLAGPPGQLAATQHRLSRKFANLINLDPHRWRDAADWFNAIEPDQAHWGTDCQLREGPATHPDEHNLLDPLLGRLRAAWRSIHFQYFGRLADYRYHDFCKADARRIALLTALTYCRDFNGGALGLNCSWVMTERKGMSGRQLAGLLVGPVISEDRMAEVLRYTEDELDVCEPDQQAAPPLSAASQIGRYGSKREVSPGWTAEALFDVARISESTFKRIRNKSDLPRGKAGHHGRLYSAGEVQALIRAAEEHGRTMRAWTGAAMAWREMLDDAP